MRLIDADALKQFEISFLMSDGYGYADVVYAGYIHQAPTIDAVPVVHGEWDCSTGLPTCTACGKAPRETYIDGSEKWPYCPMCGARMEAWKDDE